MRTLSLIIFMLPLLLATKSMARSLVQVPVDQGVVNLSGQVGLHIETPHSDQNEMTLDQVKNQVFELQSSDLLNFDYSNKIYWLRFTLQNPSSESRPLVLEIPTSWLDRVSFYQPQGEGYSEETVGDMLPHATKKQFRYPTFFLTVPPGDTLDYYLRIQGEDALTVPLRLTSPTAYHEHSLLRAYGLGGYGGLILVLTLYNFIVFISLRDRNYLFYVLYILCIGMMQAVYEGFGTQYLWYENPWLGHRLLIIATYLPMFFALLFTLGFLEIKQKSRRMERLLQGIFVFLMGLASSTFVVSDYSDIIQLMSLLSFLFPILLIVVGFTILRRSSRAAGFYLLAWLPLLASVIIYVLTLRGFMPTNAVTTNAIYYGSALESILLSFALADRMKTLIRKQSHLTAQLEAAECVQKALIFDKTPIPGLKYSSYYRSADITGGDWYGLFNDSKNNRSYILIGDVTGHGIPSALVTGAVAGAAEVAIPMLAERSLPLLESLRTIALQLNQVVLKTGQAAGEMMTMALIGIDRDTLQAAYLNCGHTHICVASKGKVQSTLEPGSLLGSEELTIAGKEFKVELGDILFVFTDGLLENHATRQKPIRWKSIARILSRQAEPKLITKELGELVQKVTAGESLRDDCTFLVIQIQDSPKSLAS
jgi:serine phosphatase RsbU (regulator of sigma subunit)